MDLISLLGPLEKVIDFFSDARKTRNERLERLRQCLNLYLMHMKGRWDSISQNTITENRMHGDLLDHYREMSAMMDDLLFWKFHRGMYWKERVTEFLRAYEDLKILQPTKDAYKIRHDFADQKAESIMANIYHLIS